MPSGSVWIRILFLLLFCLNSGCSREEPEPGQAEKNTIRVWFHSGQEAERLAITAQVDRFNQRRKSIAVDLTFIPERDYNAQVQAAALADELPDILEFDGPYLYNYVWQNHLLPLENLLPKSIKDDLLPSVIAQGTYGGHLYSVGTFDSGLALYADRLKLMEIGARLPRSPAEGWTIWEFNSILRKLAANDPDGAVLDLKLNYSGEWFTYAFSPVLQSAGADLIDRQSYRFADGVLNSPSAVQALRQVRDWIAGNYVDRNVDDAAFISGRVALSWAGHWEYGRYAAALGENLIIVPLPDFGKGMKTGQGSWSWGITRRCSHPEEAAEFLKFLLQTDEILVMTDGNGAVPATRDAIGESQLYGSDKPLHLFAVQLLEGYSLPRPRTPAYPVITSAFQQAFLDIINGAEIRPALDRAVEMIEEDLRDSDFYQRQ